MANWPDGYLISVAYQLVRRLEWDRITTDSTLSLAAFTNVFDRLRALDIEVASDGDDDVTYRDAAAETAARPLLAELRALVSRLRTAGAAAYVDPGDLPERLHCTVEYPREWFGVPDGELERVEILNFTDMPPEDPRWRARSRVADCRELRLLKLVSVRLDVSALDIDLGRLSKLVALNLDANRLTALPSELAAAASLEWLSLNENPITAESLEPLRALPRLRYLGLIRTNAQAGPDRVRAIVPRDCVIQYVAG
jgi:hypothetical protein